MFSAILIGAIVSAFTVTTSIELPAGPVEAVDVPGAGRTLMLPGCTIGCTGGLPDLPSQPYWVDLPEGTVAARLTPLSARWEAVPGTWSVRPLPRPAIPSLSTGAPITQPDPSVYSTDSFWPSTPVELAGTGYPGGHPAAELIVHPLRYNPVTGELERLLDIAVSIETRPSVRTLSPGRATTAQTMLIVTDEEILAPMQALADWRSEGGILTEVVTTGEIAGSWPGIDLAEQIRSYVIDRVEADGFDYLLLGGDTKYIPCRYAFALSYETGGGRDDSLPCDLYFSDLDGTWNLDGDDVWGEVEDDVDLYPDILVGRAPVENLEEAWVFVDKTIAYETADSVSHLDDALLMGAVMWTDPFTDGGVLCDYLDEAYIYDFYEVNKQYESQGTYGTGLAVAALCMGTNVVNITAHGWWSIAGCLTSPEVDGVNSYGRFFGMATSDGCWTAAFDFDAIAEHFVTNPQGCGISYIGNSSYGWGSPGNPLWGYGDKMSKEVFRCFFDEPSYTLGEMVAGSKLPFTPFSHEANTYRCLQFMVNLLGDPAARPHRMAPVNPVVSVPAMVTAQTTLVPVTVAAPGISVEGALVCIHDGAGHYAVEELDASGFAIVDVSGMQDGDLEATVTGTHLGRTTVAMPFGTGPLAVPVDISIDNPAGYGHLSPGTESGVSITLANQGTQELTGVQLQAVLVEGPGQVTQPSIVYGTIPQGGSSAGAGQVSVSVDAAASTGDIVRLSLGITSGQGSWSCELPLLVYAPGLYLCTTSIDDSAGGNGNGWAEPGETFDLLVDIANIGLLGAPEVCFTVQDKPSWLSFATGFDIVEWIGPDSTGTAVLTGSLSPSAPELDFPWIAFDIFCDGLWYSLDSMVFIAGDAGISEDVESGSPGWTHEGAGDLWHVTQSSAHSGEHSWHCALEPAGGYTPGMNCGLVSPAFLTAPDAEVTFWSRFDLALYGGDGLYVLLHRLSPQGSVDTLDFIGAGGLLGSGARTGGGATPLNENWTWLPRTYDISDLCGTGDSARLELWFFSDGDAEVGAGFWIDDIVISGCYTGGMGSGGGTPPVVPFLGVPVPNPCRGAFSVQVFSPQGPWTLSVRDLAGRLVESRSFEAPWTGVMDLALPGAPGGVYFVRMESAAGTASRKLVLIR